MRNYYYIYFDNGSLKDCAPNEDDYFYICTADLRKEEDVQVVTYPLDYLKNSLLHNLYVLAHRLSVKFKTSLFERLFYPFYFRKQSTDKPLCFVISGFYITPWYIKFLREKYKNCKIVKIFRDSFVLWRRRNPFYTDEDLKLFDSMFSYDVGESLKFNMIHFDEIESKVVVPIADKYPLCDVFFAGAAKDRLPLIVDICDKLVNNGISCYFYITNTKKEDQVERPGIVYSNSWMTYKEMLYYTVNSKVILEINQGNIDGYTSRFLEAVIYNKKLITNNLYVKNNPYYNEKFINCFSNPDDIDINFIKSEELVDYKYKGEFSPVYLINSIDKALVENNG